MTMSDKRQTTHAQWPPESHPLGVCRGAVARSLFDRCRAKQVNHLGRRDRTRDSSPSGERPPQHRPLCRGWGVYEPERRHPRGHQRLRPKPGPRSLQGCGRQTDPAGFRRASDGTCRDPTRAGGPSREAKIGACGRDATDESAGALRGGAIGRARHVKPRPKPRAQVEVKDSRK